MLNVSKDDVVADPFPHIYKDMILDPDIYQSLKADYPDATVFSGQKSEFGSVNSRTGQGLDIYRGDAAYDTLVSRSKAWAEFDAYINSKDFVNTFIEIFGSYLQELACAAEISPDRYQRDLIEPREVMRAQPTLRDRMRSAGEFLTGGRSRAGVSDPNLFTRLDIHRAMEGYAKKVHCDRPNRLCSLIVYFCDADQSAFTGGDLTIHKLAKDVPVAKCSRHPDPKEAPIVATIRPKENTGVFFPCSNNSYHGVTRLESHGDSRDYLYINISAETENLW